MSEVTLLTMTGIRDTSQVGTMMADARQAITHDIIERAQRVSDISQIVLSTNALPLAKWAQSRGVAVELDPPGSTFHFGQCLQALVAKHHADWLFYMGGSSGALLSADEMALIVERLCSSDRILITNNFYSTDFVAFTPVSVLDTVEPPAMDDDLGWALDADGRPTEDPQAAIDGTLLPIGGPKGYGLALAVDVLAGVLTGSDYGVHLSSVHDLSRPASVGFVVQAVDITAFRDWAEYEKDMESLIGDIRNSPCAQGIDRIFLPGEIEWLKWRERKQSGIPIPVKVLEQLQDLASELGVTVDLPLS